MVGPATAVMHCSVTPPPFWNRIKSPACKPVFPVLMLMQVMSKVTVLPFAAMAPAGHPGLPPAGARKIGNSLSVCGLAGIVLSISELSAKIMVIMSVLKGPNNVVPLFAGLGVAVGRPWRNPGVIACKVVEVVGNV